MKDLEKPKMTSDIDELLNFYVEQLGHQNNEDAFHSLLEFEGNILPSLFERYEQQDDADVKANLIEIVWRRKQDQQILQFLSKAANDTNPIIWKAAIDGIVSIGGHEALKLLKDIDRQVESSKNKHEWIAEAITQIEEQLKHK